VIAFQAASRLVADGIVGPKTAARLGVDRPA
jgi:peptidoglycan hydrolase-like protein with peptidoglycan-binding domain